MSDDLTIPRPGYRPVRRSRYQVDPANRQRLLIAGGLAVVVMTVVGVSMLRSHSQGVPVVQAEAGPVRVKPANPGGLQVASANNEVFSGGQDTADSKLAPAPEMPDPAALRPPVPAAVGPAAVAPSPALPMTAPMTAPPPAAEVRPAKPAPAAAAPHPAAARTPAEAPHAIAAGEASRPTPAPAAAAHAPAASGHGAVVQLAALGSEDAARAEWQHLEKRMPDLLGGHQPTVSRVEHDGHTFWRLRTAGFADVAQARSFCDHVRAKGGGCSVADF